MNTVQPNPMAFRLASDLQTKQTVWIDQNGQEHNPLQICAYYRQKYAEDVKKPTF